MAVATSARINTRLLWPRTLNVALALATMLNTTAPGIDATPLTALKIHTALSSASKGRPTPMGALKMCFTLLHVVRWFHNKMGEVTGSDQLDWVAAESVGWGEGGGGGGGGSRKPRPRCRGRMCAISGCRMPAPESPNPVPGSQPIRRSIWLPVLDSGRGAPPTTPAFTPSITTLEYVLLKETDFSKLYPFLLLLFVLLIAAYSIFVLLCYLYPQAQSSHGRLTSPSR